MLSVSGSSRSVRKASPAPGLSADPTTLSEVGIAVVAVWAVTHYIRQSTGLCLSEEREVQEFERSTSYSSSPLPLRTCTKTPLQRKGSVIDVDQVSAIRLFKQSKVTALPVPVFQRATARVYLAVNPRLLDCEEKHILFQACYDCGRIWLACTLQDIKP